MEGLSDGQRRCLAILMSLGGSATAQEIESRYGSKYVYELLDQLIEANYVLRETDERSVYRLTCHGFKAAYPIACLDAAILENETRRLDGVFGNVLLGQGFKKHEVFEMLRTLLIAVSYDDVLMHYNDGVVSMHEIVGAVLRLCRRNLVLRDTLLARWLQAISVDRITSHEHGDRELLLRLATKTLGRSLDELIVYAHSRLRWRIRRLVMASLAIYRDASLAIGLILLTAAIIFLLYIIFIGIKT